MKNAKYPKALIGISELKPLLKKAKAVVLLVAKIALYARLKV
jgi:hypothetical protein